MAMVNREAKRDVQVSKDALLKSYSKRLKDDVRSLADNFSAIVKTCRFSGMKTIWHFCYISLSVRFQTKSSLVWEKILKLLTNFFKPNQVWFGK